MVQQLTKMVWLSKQQNWCGSTKNALPLDPSQSAFKRKKGTLVEEDEDDEVTSPKKKRKAISQKVTIASSDGLLIQCIP